MSKIQVTKQQRANALFARDVMWPSVPAKNVIKELADWRQPNGEVTCGTLACFGGWVAVNPHFMKQGVSASYYGVPQIQRRDEWGGRVAQALFGEYDLFSSRQDEERGTDHQIVTKRLNRLIRNSVVES